MTHTPISDSVRTQSTVTAPQERKKQLLAERLRRARSLPSGPGPRQADAVVPLGPTQTGLWVEDRMDPGSAAYVVGFGLRVQGPVDQQRIREACRALMARYDILRVRYPADDLGEPTVVLHEDTGAEIPVMDLRGVDDPLASAEEEFSHILATPFDIAAGPLARFHALTLADDDHVVLFTAHHLIVDGWSVELLKSHLRQALEQAAHNGSIDLGARPLQYEDIAVYEATVERAARRERALAQRVERLAGTRNLELDVAKPRPATMSSRGRTHEFTLPAGLVEQLKALAAAEGATFYMAVLALYQVLLARHSTQRDFVIGTPVANRDTSGAEDVVGNFVNMVAMRSQLADNPSFRELLSRSRETALDAFSSQNVPFGDIVKALALPRVANTSPLFQVSLAVDELATAVKPATNESDALRFSEIGATTAVTHYDLGLHICSDEAGRYVASLMYRTDLFDAFRIETLADRLTMLLARVVADPMVRVLDIDLLTDTEHDLVTRVWAQGPVRKVAPDRTLHQLIRLGANRDPSRPAVVEGDEAITVGQLHGRADRIALRLAAKGIGPDVKVAIAFNRAIPAATSILGVLAAGGAYVPLDPAMPRDRLEYILADSHAALCIHDGTLEVDTDVETISYDDLLAERSVAVPTPAAPSNLAYVIYTSGTTGRPKGVEVEQREVVHYLRDVSSDLDVVRGGSYALLQSLAFDFSLPMFYLPLIHDGTLHAMDGRITGEELARFLARHEVNHLKMTPSHLAALTAQVAAAAVAPRRSLVLSGEGSPSQWMRDLAKNVDCRVINNYGPTEAIGACTATEVTPDLETLEAVWPIGTPMPGVRTYVLDDRLRPVPPGVRGELYISGRLARGYLSRPGMTASCFVADPLSGAGERMYRTGDVVSWRPDGQLAFHGRTDDQIKIRGYRVELGEVESVLATMEGVAQCVVDLRGEPGHERLVGWIRWAEGITPVADAGIRDHLARTLPDYMIPRAYATVDVFPTKGNGKVDRAALTEPERGVVAAADIAPRTELEAGLAAVYADLLGIRTPSVVADFFDLGGDSLLATKAVAYIKPIVGEEVTVSVMDIISNPTIEKLAKLIEDRRGGGVERHLLYELTKPISAAERVASIVTIPYGGANASVFSDLAEALPTGYSLYSVEPPGHDVALGGEALPTRELAAAVADEILQRIDGNLIIYGHCVPGSAVAAAVAEELTRRGRGIEALYVGGAFPVARPANRVLATLARWSAQDRLTADRHHVNWLAGMGTDINSMDSEHAAHMVKAMRRDARFAEDYFTDVFSGDVQRIQAPAISVIGESDQATRFWEERTDEWSVYSDRTASVCIQDAGHYFLNYRPDELAEILTTVHCRVMDHTESGLTRPVRGAAATWWLYDSRIVRETVRPGHQPRLRSVLQSGRESAETLPGLGKFAIIASGQMISFTGSTLTEFALPLWVLTQTNDLVLFGIVGVLGVLPNLIVSPIAGAVVDRFNRRTLIMLFDAACMVLLALLLLLTMTNAMELWNMMLAFGLVACAVTCQRVAFQSALPQIVPKRYLGHANGMLQSAIGAANFIAPLFGVGLLAVFGLPGILAFDVVSYVFAIATVALVRFPTAMPEVPESLWEEIRGGFRFSMRSRYFRSMLLYFALINLFLAPLLSLVAPMVLTFGSLSEVAVVTAIAGGAGILAGIGMSIWGGPRRRRMDAVRVMSLMLGICALIVASRPWLPLVCVGVFGLSGLIMLANSVVMTIIQTKVPARLQGRVFAINTMVSTASAPLGFGVLAPQGTALMEWLMANVPGVEPAVHAVLGDGPGRAIAMVYVVCGVVVLALVISTRRWNALVRFDDEVPDASPDDLIGLAQSRARRDGGTDVVRTIEETGTPELEKVGS